MAVIMRIRALIPMVVLASMLGLSPLAQESILPPPFSSLLSPTFTTLASLSSPWRAPTPLSSSSPSPPSSLSSYSPWMSQSPMPKLLRCSHALSGFPVQERRFRRRTWLFLRGGKVKRTDRGSVEGPVKRKRGIGKGGNTVGRKTNASDVAKSTNYSQAEPRRNSKKKTDKLATTFQLALSEDEGAEISKAVRKNAKMKPMGKERKKVGWGRSIGSMGAAALGSEGALKSKTVTEAKTFTSASGGKGRKQDATTAWINDGLGGKYDPQGFTGRKTKGDNLRIFKLHVLKAQNKACSGKTASCPFDCDCCFI